MKITITGTTVIKAVSILATVCMLAMLVAKVFGFTDVDTAVLLLLLLLLVNASTLSLAFTRRSSK